MPCAAQHPQHLSTSLFTEADLAWDSLPSAPPTHLDLRLVSTHEDVSSPDILADLEAVTPRVPAPQHPPLPDLPFDISSQRDVLAAHLLRPSNLEQLQHGQQLQLSHGFRPVDWPSLRRFSRRPSLEKAELTSPTDIAWASFSTSEVHTANSASFPCLKEEDLTEIVVEEAVLQGVKLESQLVNGLKKDISKPRRARKSVTPQPSRFCHICARTQKSRKMFCANLNTEKKCRKAVCEPCFVELSWDFQTAMDGREKWLCPHCRGMCNSVPKARCHIYTKTNEKRKSIKRS